MRALRRVVLLVVLGASLPGPARAGTILVQHVSASARASLVRFDPHIAGNGGTDDIAPSGAEVSTLGLYDFRSSVSHARAATADATTTTSYQTAGVTAEQSAAPGEDNAAADAQELPTGTASDAHARLVDLAAGICPPADAHGERILSTAGASVADAAAGPLSLHPGIVSSRSTISLVPRAGGALSVRAVAEAQVSSIRIADAYELRIVGRPRLELVASGVAGGASISYNAPVIDVIDLSTNEPVARLDAAHQSFDLTPDDDQFYSLGPPVNLRLGAPHNSIVTADGRFVRTEADLVQIRSTEGLEVINAHVAPLVSSVSAPAGGVTTCDGGSAPVVDRSVPHIVVYERASGWEHTSIVQASEAIADIANITGEFTVEVTNDPSFVRPDALAGIDAVYFNSTTGNFPWSTDQKEVFVRWLLCGGGTIGTHAASDANHGVWPQWQELIGAEFAAHPHPGYEPVIGEATVLVDDHTSPITEPWHEVSSFRWAEEYYKFKKDPRGTQDVNVLLSLDETTVYPSQPVGVGPFFGYYGHHQPLAWTKTFRGKGRVFYTAFGHNGFAWAHPEFRHHMLRGVEWVTQVRPDPGCLSV